MKNKKLRKISLVNLILGYLLAFSFILSIVLNSNTKVVEVEVVEENNGLFIEDEVAEEELFNGAHGRETVYIDRPRTNIVRDYEVGKDRGIGIVLDDDQDVVIVGNDDINDIAVVSNPDHVVLHDRDVSVIHNERYLGNDVGLDNRNYVGDRIHSGGVVDNAHNNHRVREGVDQDIDVGLLDRRLEELNREVGNVDLDAYNDAIAKDKLNKDKFGLDKDDEVDFSQLTLAKDDHELGDI